jgi:hypothetical protein
LPAFTLTPVQRQQEGVRGLTTNQLIRYIADTLVLPFELLVNLPLC